MSADGTIKYILELDATQGRGELDTFEREMRRSQDLLQRGMADPTAALESGLRKAAEAQRVLQRETEGSLNGLKRMVESADQVSGAMTSAFGLTKVLNERASVSMAVMGATMGGVGGAAIMLAPLVAEVGLQFYKLVSGAGAAEKQLAQVKEMMEQMDGVLKSLGDSLAKAAERKTGDFFHGLAQEAKLLEGASTQLKSYADAQAAMAHAREESAVSQLEAERSAKLAGVTGRDEDLEKQKIILKYAKDIADVRRNAARAAADSAVGTAQNQAALAGEKVQLNRSQQEQIAKQLADAEAAKRGVVSAAGRGGAISDQEEQLMRLHELRDKQDFFNRTGKTLSQPEQGELNSLSGLAPALLKQIAAGDVTYKNAGSQRTDPMAQSAGARAEALGAIADAEIKKFRDSLQQARDAAATLTQGHREATDAVKVAEANRAATIEKSKAVQAELDRQTHELSRSFDQRKAQHESEAATAKRNASNQQAEKKQAAENESIQEFVQRLSDFAKGQNDKADTVERAHKKGATGLAALHGYDPGQTALEQQMESLRKSASPDSLRAIAHKFFTPELLAKAQTPTREGRFLKQQIDDVQKIISSASAHGKQVAHDLGKDKAGHKVVARVHDKNARQEKDPVEEATRQMAEHMAQLKSLLEAKLTVF